MFRPRFGLAPLALWLAALTCHAQPANPAAVNELDKRLAQEARLSWIERAALARHPAVWESNARVTAASERASGADRLPDLEFKYEQWGVPLSRPYALNRAGMVMFGLRQAFPAAGAREARGRAAAEQAHITSHQRDALERDLLLRVRRTYFEYYAADRVLRVHLEHVGVAEQIVNQVRSNYEVGRGDQQDVLRVLVELSRLHNDLAEIRQQRESSRLMLNSLMARAPDAPLGPPVDPERPSGKLDPAELERARTRGRPELAGAQRAIRRSEAALDAAKHAARRPSFMVGADYWLMPTQEMPHAYGAMVAMSLPWLNAGRRSDVREAEQLLSADRHAAEATDTLTAFELHDAVARLEAASSSLEIIEGSVLPQADKSLQATKASFALGQASLLDLLDSLRAYFQVRLEHSRALSRVMAQLASVEFASGARLLATPTTEKSE
jgi:cobalt-zinc-cadmium efflux system outer membrane protein